jgi:predicted nucleic acid-binding Zn finger protein
MTTATLTRLTLSPFVDAAIARFPVGERAVKAAELLLAGKVQRISNDAQGRDQWAAYGDAKDTNGKPLPYTVSIKAGTCGCMDMAAPKSQTGQKLCKHMLAAMYALKAGITAPASPAGLIAQLLAAATSSVRLYVDMPAPVQRYYGSRERAAAQREVCWLVAYRIDGGGERVELAERMDVSGSDFWNTVEAAGWTKSGGTRPSGFGGLATWELTQQPVAVDWPQPQPQAEALFADAKLNRDEDDELWA